jgi:hypothetical protein
VCFSGRAEGFKSALQIEKRAAREKEEKKIEKRAGESAAVSICLSVSLRKSLEARVNLFLFRSPRGLRSKQQPNYNSTTTGLAA